MKQTKAHTPHVPVPSLLVILDGFGLAPHTNLGNAITPHTAPFIFSCMSAYPSTKLTAHGRAVGLFPGQPGNSEAGHLNIGAGRLVKQDVVRISDAIADGTFFKNTAFTEALFHAKKYHSAVHVMGLLSNGKSGHAHIDHLCSLLEFFRRNKHKKVFLHLFTDGRDTSPHSAIKHLQKVRKCMRNGERIASIMGRFYGMDRNKHWLRTQEAYEAIVQGKGHCLSASAEDAITAAYNRGETDEFVCPTVLMHGERPIATVNDNDVVYFFNARSDRARQLTKAFVQEDFNEKNPGSFKRARVPKNIRFVAMTDFGPDLHGIFTAFPSPDVRWGLAKAIGERFRQLYISESEKYAHVTYFINGGYAQPINGEERMLVPSPTVTSYAHKPHMSAKKLTDTIITALEKKQYEFICVNYPNADMVGHTGNFEAAQKAVRFLDRQIKRLVTYALKHNGQVLLTADHGNAEEMIRKKTGEPMTEHTCNPVPCVYITKHPCAKRLRPKGSLVDIAPTVLDMLCAPKPGEMTGSSLLTHSCGILRA